eukprot:2136123-Rhodomonas_salina.1
MPCLVGVERIGVPVCYAMSGTDEVWGYLPAMRCLVSMMRVSLPLCYTMCGTDGAYGGTRG